MEFKNQLNLFLFFVIFQSLKFFAHEDIYLKKLEKIREKEINNLKKRVYYECFISTLGEMTPHWVSHHF